MYLLQVHRPIDNYEENYITIYLKLKFEHIFITYHDNTSMRVYDLFI